MSGFLLDTDTLSDLVRDPKGRVAARIAEVGEEEVATSIVVAAELRFGAYKKGSTRLSARIDVILGAMKVLPIGPPCDEVYGRLRSDLERRGSPIGGNDMLIAAHALTLDRSLVTGNVREFKRVSELRLANWLA